MRSNDVLIDLRLDMYAVPAESKHPQIMMSELGIEYLFPIPQSISDGWEFYGCFNVPDELPNWLSVMDVPNPADRIGWGMNKEMADLLVAARAE